MGKRFDIIGLENGMVDLALQIDEIPSSGGLSRMKNYLWQPGGNVDNALAAAARQGAACSFMGAVGNDNVADFFRKDLDYHGIDTSHLLNKEGSTTIVVCLAEEKTKERSFISYSGNGPDGSPDLDPADIDEEFISSARYLHVGGASGKTMQRVVETARNNGVIVSVDGGFYSDSLAWTLDHCDIMIMSREFYTALFGKDENYIDNMRALIEKHSMDTAIVTLGSDGCAGADRNGETFRIPAFSGHEIIDTTGAGDVFHGGFLFAHSQGWDLRTCAVYASAVSFIKCTALGGRVGIPSRNTVEQFLKDGTIDRTDTELRMEHYRGVMRFE